MAPKGKNAQRKLQRISAAHGALVPYQPVPQATSKNTVANIGSNIQGKRDNYSHKNPKNMPNYQIAARGSPFLGMLMNPVDAQPALPPISLPVRATPLKQYNEVLLSTDANGNCGLFIYPFMAAQTSVGTITGTTYTGAATAVANPENASFQTNFSSFIPLCYEVVVKFTGSYTNVAGRMYGIVAPNGANDGTKFPLDPNGCEAITSDGISCSWYSTSPVWNNPALASATTGPAEWMDTTTCFMMLGGPPSAVNCLSVGIYLHLAAFPKAGICGLTPMAALPDPGAQLAASLMASSTEGVGVSSTSLAKRDKLRKRKALIRDVIKMGGKAVGTVFPMTGTAVSVAGMLADLLG